MPLKFLVASIDCKVCLRLVFTAWHPNKTSLHAINLA